MGGLVLYSSPSASYDADLLIGAGLVRKAYLASVSFEYLGLAPNYREAAEKGRVELVECDEATVIGGLMAAAEGLPYHLARSLKATDVVEASELCRRFVADGEELLLVVALRPDVGALHAQQADEYGNARHLGATFADLLIAKACRRVVVTVDELVSHQRVLDEPWRTTIPGYMVDAVVEIPYGAHPCSSHGLYLHDEEHLRDYLAAAEATRRGSEPQAWARYVARYASEPASPSEYLDRIGGPGRLARLRQG